MSMSAELEYYSLEDLVGIKASIDREAHPHRYERVSALVEQRLVDMQKNEIPAAPLLPYSRKALLKSLLLFVGISCYPIWSMYTGVIHSRRGRDTLYAEEPTSFVVSIALFFIVAAIPLILVLKNRVMGIYEENATHAIDSQ